MKKLCLLFPFKSSAIREIVRNMSSGKYCSAPKNKGYLIDVKNLLKWKYVEIVVFFEIFTLHSLKRCILRNTTSFKVLLRSHCQFVSYVSIEVLVDARGITIQKC